MPPGPQTVTVPGVQLVKVGTWPASTGNTRVTLEDLQAMVDAQGDPAVLPAAVKFGHVDPRFDGEPAYGWVSNLRLAGDVLVGDLVDVPAGLAAILPKAFRHRSVEIAWGVRTPQGTRHRAALAGLALLGSTPPAVAGLADIEALYRTAASGSALDRVTPLPVASDGTPWPEASPVATADGSAATGWEALATLAAALVRAEGAPVGQTVLDQAHHRAPEGHVDDRRIRELLAMADQQGADAVVAALRSDVTAASNPTPGGGGAPPAPPTGGTTSGQAAGAAAPGAPAGQGAAPAAPAGAAPIPQQGAVAPAAAGPASGTPAAAPAGQAGAPPAGAAPSAPGAAGAAAAPSSTPGAIQVPTGVPGLPPGMTAISNDVLAELQRKAEAGAGAAQQLNDQALEQELATAFRGRWLPAERDSLLTWLRQDPTTARANLSARPQLLPLDELGTDQGPSAAADEAAWDKFEEEIGWREPAAQPTTTGGNA